MPHCQPKFLAENSIKTPDSGLDETTLLRVGFYRADVRMDPNRLIDIVCLIFFESLSLERPISLCRTGSCQKALLTFALLTRSDILHLLEMREQVLVW